MFFYAPAILLATLSRLIYNVMVTNFRFMLKEQCYSCGRIAYDAVNCLICHSCCWPLYRCSFEDDKKTRTFTIIGWLFRFALVFYGMYYSFEDDMFYYNYTEDETFMEFSLEYTGGKVVVYN